MFYALHSVFVFMFGTIFGSFFNVCIYRLPLEESVVAPPSHCPKCNHPIRWYDNIPILSFIFLRAKCRDCGTKISIRYPVIELITGLGFLWMWIIYGLSVQAFVGVFLFSCLLIATVVDIDHQIIPDEVSLGGLVVGLILSFIFPAIHAQQIWWKGGVQGLVGALAGGGIIYITGVVGDFVFKKESMGGGDVKLLAMIGSIVGWQNVLLVFFLAPVLAVPLGLYLKFVKHEEVLPFGPFISVAGWIAFLWGEPIIYWYLNGMRFS